MQKPHCSAWHSRKPPAPGAAPARRGGPSRARPSTVVTSCPSTWTASIRHERTGSPSTSTVHAPQTPCSQPTCVPVSPRSWRSASDSSRRTGTVASRGTPFTVTVIVRSVSTLMQSSRLPRPRPRPAFVRSGRRPAAAGSRRSRAGRCPGRPGARERAGGGPVRAVDRLADHGVGQVVHLGDQPHRDVGGADGGDAAVVVQRDDDAGAADRVVALAAGDLGEGGARARPAARGRRRR